MNFLQSSPHPHVRNKIGVAYDDGTVRVWDLIQQAAVAEFADAVQTCYYYYNASRITFVYCSTTRQLPRWLFLQ